MKPWLTPTNDPPFILLHDAFWRHVVDRIYGKPWPFLWCSAVKTSLKDATKKAPKDTAAASEETLPKTAPPDDVPSDAPAPVDAPTPAPAPAPADQTSETNGQGPDTPDHDGKRL